jgi:hypothetical protein
MNEDQITTAADKFRAFLNEQGIAKGKIDGIVDEFTSYLPGEAMAFYPSTSRGAVVETVEAYGLLIEVDANGRAARVGLPVDRGTASHSETLDVEYVA